MISRYFRGTQYHMRITDLENGSVVETSSEFKEEIDRAEKSILHSPVDLGDMEIRRWHTIAGDWERHDEKFYTTKNKFASLIS